MRLCRIMIIAFVLTAGPAVAQSVTVQSYAVPAGAHPHDVAAAPDGSVWYTAQHQGALGRLDPATGKTVQVPLGQGSSPHGVIVGPDGLAWVTDSGLNAIVAVDPKSLGVKRYPLPESVASANLNTAAFDGAGVLWFTGQSGLYGKLDPKAGTVAVFDAPKGRGPYGIAATPTGEVWFVSLAGSYLARIDSASGQLAVFEPPTTGAGLRRVWSDSKGMLWVSEWNAGKVGRYDPASGQWQEWPLPGERPQAYSVYVDEQDKVWLSDFGANAVLRFDPVSERFEVFPADKGNAAVRQMLGRPYEAWAAESGTDRLTVYRYGRR